MATMETITQTEPTKNLQVEIPAFVHKALAVEAARRETTIKALVAQSVIAYLDLDASEVA